MNYSLSVCLTDLEGAQVQANENGQKFVFIPIDKADLFLSEQGKVFLTLNMWANKSGQPNQYGKTHTVKQNFSKEKNEMLKAQGIKAPLLGSGRPIQLNYPQQQNQAVFQQTAPQGYQQPTYPQNPAPQNNPFAQQDNTELPF